MEEVLNQSNDVMYEIKTTSTNLLISLSCLRRFSMAETEP